MRNAVIAILLAIALALFFGAGNNRPVSLREEEEEDTVPVKKPAKDSAKKLTAGNATDAVLLPGG